MRVWVGPACVQPRTQAARGAMHALAGGGGRGNARPPSSAAAACWLGPAACCGCQCSAHTCQHASTREKPGQRLVCCMHEDQCPASPAHLSTRGSGASRRPGARSQPRGPPRYRKQPAHPAACWRRGPAWLPAPGPPCWGVPRGGPPPPRWVGGRRAIDTPGGTALSLAHAACRQGTPWPGATAAGGLVPARPPALPTGCTAPCRCWRRACTAGPGSLPPAPRAGHSAAPCRLCGAGPCCRGRAHKS